MFSAFVGGATAPPTRRPIHACTMTDVEYLRHQARRCFRLARSINDPNTVAQLEALGREFEQRASELERRC
jgi:hypothetical protein